MNLNAVVNAQNAANGASTTPSTNTSQTLGQSDFLKLLTTQLTMQDPTNPVDNKDMISQMAQFSSVAGISKINDTLSSILTKIDALGTATSTGSSATSPSTDTSLSQINDTLSAILAKIDALGTTTSTASTTTSTTTT